MITAITTALTKRICVVKPKVFTPSANKYFSNVRKLGRDSNQALGLGQYSIDFLRDGKPSQKVMERCKLFHTDSIFCGISAIALRTNAPSILKAEALESTSSG